MANNVLVTLPTAGVSIAAEEIGGVEFQLVKIVDGAAGSSSPVIATSGVPAAGSVGLVVAVKPGVSVSAQVAGSVAISGVAQVSGTVSVSAMPAVSGTVQVSGPVSVPSVTVVSTIVTLLGTVLISVAPSATVGTIIAVSGVTAVSVVSTIGTLLGTVAVNVVAGGAGGGSVTVAPPSISATGQIVWIVGGQGTTANPVVVTGTVSAGAGTTVVSLQSIVPVTTAASVSVSGLPVWLNPTQQVVVSGLAGHSVTGSVNIVSTAVVTLATGGTIATILGTQLVSVAASAIVGTIVAVSGVTAVSAVSTIVTILSTVNVAIVAGAGGGGSVTVAPPSISATGQVVWMAGGQSTTAFPVYVSIPGVAPVTTAASVSVTALPVWLNPTQQVVVSGLAGHSITGSVNIVSTALVSIAASAIVGTIVAVSGVTAVSVVSTVGTVLGTVNVAIVAGAGGGGSVTTAGPSLTATGQVVWVAGGQSAQTNPVWMSGTVAISIPVSQTVGTIIAVSGVTAVSAVSTIVTILSTVNVAIVAGAGGGGSVTVAPPSISATGQVVWMAGGQSTTAFPVYVSIPGVAPVTTAASVSVTGLPVWLNPTQQVAVIGSVNVISTAVVTLATGGTIATILGTQLVSVAASAIVGTIVAVSGVTAVSAVSTIVTLLGTVNVAIVAGAGGGGSVTTAGPSVTATGQVIWVAGGQSAQANPVWMSGTVAIVPGVSVVAQASGTVSVSGTVVVTLATGGTVATLLGTVVVSVVPGLSVTIQQGASVSAVVSGTVAVLTGGGLPGSTTGSSGMSGVLVWLGASQTVLISTQVSGTVSVSNTVVVTLATGGTIATLLGTQLVSVAASAIVGTIVAVSGVTAVSAVSTIVTILGTQIVTVAAGASISVVNVVNSVVTVLGTAVVSLATGGSVAALDVGRTQVMLVMTSTSVGISGTMMLFTAYQGMSQSAVGTTGYVVPAGKTFRVLAAAIVVANSVTSSPAIHRLFVCASTAAPTWTSAVPVVAAVGANAQSAGVNYSACAIGIADVPAGVTVGLAHTINTSGGTVIQAVVNGYLFP